MTTFVSLAIVTVAGYALFSHARQIREAIEEFSGRWGGGSPPSHPLPGNDAFILLRRRKKLAVERDQ